MRQKYYAILITDHLNSGYTTLHDRIFFDEEDAKLEIKNLATEYIRRSVEKKRKVTLEYNENMLMINSKPTPNCMFAEITYYIQEVNVQEPFGIAEDSKKAKNALVAFAKNELDLIVKDMKKDVQDKDAIFMQEEVNHEILDLIELFSEQGHSGTSAPYVINRIKRLASWKPLSPLTGEDDEWMNLHDLGDKVTEQNRRYSGLFRDNKDNSTAHDINAVVFSDNGGVTWFGAGWLEKKLNVRDQIVFPYTPPTKPKEVYVRWLDENMEEAELVESEEERAKQREEFYQKEKEAGWRD